MSKKLSFFLVAAVVFLTVICFEFNTVAINAATYTAQKAAVKKGKVKKPRKSQSFDNVKIWRITLSGISTIDRIVSPEEARIIEKSDDDDMFVMQIEDDGPWHAVCHEYLEYTTVIVANPKLVKELNQLMDNPKYDSYRKDVKIKGNVAYARWYNGNRSGGIAEDFPQDLVDYILHQE